MKTGQYMFLITLDGVVSQETSGVLPSTGQSKQFDVNRLISTINKISPNTGREKALAILHCYGRQMVNVPTISSAERILRNNLIYKLYKEGKSYEVISKRFKISVTDFVHYVQLFYVRQISRYAPISLTIGFEK